VWIEGVPDIITGILVDFTVIKDIIGKYDHQIILNREDPMVSCIEKFQHVITTPGDPTSELLAVLIRDDLLDHCKMQGIMADVTKIRVWESPHCYAELKSPQPIAEITP